MKRINRFSFLFIVLFLFSFFSCDKYDSIEETYFDFTEGGMVPGQEYVFYPFEDSTKYIEANNNVSLDISLRYSDKCHIKTLPLIVEYSSLVKDSIVIQILDLPLFDKEDYVTGKGNFGIYESLFTIFKNQSREEGFYISISTHEQSTEGLISLGIICKKINNRSNETNTR